MSRLSSEEIDRLAAVLSAGLRRSGTAPPSPAAAGVSSAYDASGRVHPRNDLRSLSIRYAAAVETLQAFRDIEARVPREPDYVCSTLVGGGRRRPHTARPATAPRSASLRPTSARVIATKVEDARTAVQPPSVTGVRIDIHQDTESAATAGESGALERPQCGGVTDAKKRLGSAGRRPLSSKPRSTCMSEHHHAIIDQVMMREEEMLVEAQRRAVQDEEDAVAGIIEDDGDEDAALEQLAGPGRASRRIPSASSRPVSAKPFSGVHPASAPAARSTQPSRTEEADAAAKKAAHHALGTADVAHVRSDAPTPIYFNSFRHSGIGDFLRTQKTETFGVYRERLDAYIATKQRSGSSIAAGVPTAVSPSAGLRTLSKSQFIEQVNRESARRLRESKEQEGAQDTEAHRVALHQGAALRRPMSAAVAEKHVQHAYHRRPMAAVKAAVHSW